MGEQHLSGWDAQVSAFVCPFTGRWPLQDENSVAAGALSAGRRRGGGGLSSWAQPQLRWARWDADGRTLEVGVGPAVAPRSACLTIFVYVPQTMEAAPLLFAGEGVGKDVAEALDRLSERAAGKRTPLSVLVDQAVAAIEAGMAGHAGWEEEGLTDGGFDDVAFLSANHRKAADAFICFAVAAVRSLRRVSLLDPFPPTLLDGLGGRDFDACSQCLLSLPSLDPSVRPHHLSSQQGFLLRWLLDLKGVLIEGVKDASTETEHACKGDFVIGLNHGNEPSFDAAARDHGTVRAYHGSSLENFHCITRCGLKSFSGTKRMNTGDVYGEGVYLSSDFRLARSFAHRGKTWPHSTLGTHVTCVACCTIALHPNIKRQKETARMSGGNGMPMNAIPHTYYVVPDPRFVRVDCLLVIPDGTPVPPQPDRSRDTREAAAGGARRAVRAQGARDGGGAPAEAAEAGGGGGWTAKRVAKYVLCAVALFLLCRVWWAKASGYKRYAPIGATDPLGNDEDGPVL